MNRPPRYDDRDLESMTASALRAYRNDLLDEERSSDAKTRPAIVTRIAEAERWMMISNVRATRERDEIGIDGLPHVEAVREFALHHSDEHPMLCAALRVLLAEREHWTIRIADQMRGAGLIPAAVDANLDALALRMRDLAERVTHLLAEREAAANHEAYQRQAAMIDTGVLRGKAGE